MLLLSLGSDYNVFVVGRIWHEARTRPLADAVAVAVPAAAKPVTLAGLVLAGSFALLALAPVVALRSLPSRSRPACSSTPSSCARCWCRR